MRVAIVGSRHAPQSTTALIEEYLPADTTEIISGGASGVDTAAAAIAKRLGIPLTVFLPDYDTYGKRAPLVRNDQIIERADMVLAFWDGESPGTRYVVGKCLECGRRVIYIPINQDGKEQRR